MDLFVAQDSMARGVLAGAQWSWEGTELTVKLVANGKSVILRATLHFVSEEEWNEKTAITEAKAEATGIVEYYSISGARLEALQQGINIVRYGDGTVRKVFVK